MFAQCVELNQQSTWRFQNKTEYYLQSNVNRPLRQNSKTHSYAPKHQKHVSLWPKRHNLAKSNQNLLRHGMGIWPAVGTRSHHLTYSAFCSCLLTNEQLRFLLCIVFSCNACQGKNTNQYVHTQRSDQKCSQKIKVFFADIIKNRLFK